VEDWEKGKRGSAYEALAEIAQKAGGKVKGILWYQGESDALVELDSAKSATMADTYMQKTLRTFQDLRADFGTPSTPVIVVQLATMGTKNPIPLMHVRERQRQLAEAGKDIFVIPTIDLPLSSDGLHLNLQGYKAAGKRFGDCALSVAYGAKADWSGPRFKRAWFRDDRRLEFVVEFKDLKERLKVSDKAAGVFAMENGADRKTPKSVTVLNDSALLVTMEASLPADATVGYAYGGSGKPLGLTDGSGLPALPFYFQPIGASEAATGPKKTE
jgi:sialate O-acetylesterase